uniref:Putative secreted protein n=1 Tax=Ixodes ricinus TaxID=34613 RepID=A0A6B0V1R9_IXORI
MPLQCLLLLLLVSDGLLHEHALDALLHGILFGLGHHLQLLGRELHEPKTNERRRRLEGPGSRQHGSHLFLLQTALFLPAGAVDVTENFAKRLCPKPKLRGVVGSKCQKASRCSLTVITPQLAPQTRPADSEHGTYGCPLEQQEKNTHTNALIVAHRGSKVNSSKEKKKKTAPAKILHLKRHKRIMLEFKKKKENNKKPEPLVQFKRKD